MTPLKSFETRKKAEKWARGFDYARACNALPLLVTHSDDNLVEHVVYNPHPEIHAEPFRIPGTEPHAKPSTPAIQETLF